MCKRIFFTFLLLLVTFIGICQPNDSIPILILNTEIQIESTDGINSMYNFDFERADSQFRWLRGKYSWHPLPYFLLGLSQWWRIVPNINETKYDEAFLIYMDQAIKRGEYIFEHVSEVEGAFFLSAAYAFKGRLYAERHSWTKAASAGKSAMNYLDYCRNHEEFGVEIQFGDALYNYYAEWIKENYPLLKPVMLFFRNGDKDLGLKQLKNVGNNAFFTRTEAQYFLIKILSSDMNDNAGALFLTDYLHKTFPNNAYFHRYHARMLYSTGQYKQVEPVCLSIIERIDSTYQGYEQNSGRYAAYFLGEIYMKRGKPAEAEIYFKKCVQFGIEIDATDMGYHHYALLNLGKIAFKKGDKKAAKAYFKEVKKLASRSSEAHRLATSYLKDV